MINIPKLYFFFINPYLVQVIGWISENLIYTYFIGGVVGAMIVDFAYSLHLGLRVKQFAEFSNQRFDMIKKELRKRLVLPIKKDTHAVKEN